MDTAQMLSCCGLSSPNMLPDWHLCTAFVRQPGRQLGESLHCRYGGLAGDKKVEKEREK
jgi:hypothetical protein